MIVFGGFHESLRAETRFFNDVHIFDFQTLTWTELKYSKLARLPPPRSACNLAIGTAPAEALFVSGGYSKVKSTNTQGSKSEGIIHADCWMLPLKQLVGSLNAGQNPPSWERISRKGEYPSPRAGSVSTVHKNKMLVFGGVLDNEGDHHKMDSGMTVQCFNTLNA
jgi:N-acetylneuraminic acid mutarotase